VANWIDSLKAPLFVSWQITRACDLCCLHCCTESAPGKRLPDELNADAAMAIADEIVRNEVPYVMLCGGEPLVAPHFFAIAEVLGAAGVRLKIETNGQMFDEKVAERLARLPVRSIQVSLDADSQEVYARQRPGASLAKAHAACRAVRSVGLPLEITFAPTRINIHEAEAVIQRARALGAFRFNTGKLMRIGTAARLWKKLEPSFEEYRTFFTTLHNQSRALAGEMELWYTPASTEEGLRMSLEQPPATMLLLPNGLVKVAGSLPYICADLRRTGLEAAWRAYCSAWRNEAVLTDIRCAIMDDRRFAEANNWRFVPGAAA
jgi:MoaA/NifB/PqqE/SkfB family radical SAM enzyme